MPSSVAFSQLHNLPDSHAKSGSEPLLDSKARGAGTTLKIRYVGHMEVSGVRQLLLCPATLQSERSNDCTECLREVVQDSDDGTEGTLCCLLH